MTKEGENFKDRVCGKARGGLRCAGRSYWIQTGAETRGPRLGGAPGTCCGPSSRCGGGSGWMFPSVFFYLLNEMENKSSAEERLEKW